ncbi:MAG: transglutaminase family protein [Myxococcales bacterium]|nr:transglutaminase family protein [Myxococcales bacterium]
MTRQPLAHLDLVSLFAACPEPPLDVAALALSHEFQPGLDTAEVMATLDDWGGVLAERVAGLSRPADLAAAVGTYLYDELGFQGDEESYYDPRNSFLDQVMARRRGIPITLAVLVMSLARRAGVEAEGIGFPGHFLVRMGGRDGVFVDPFFGARVLDRFQLERLTERMVGPKASLREEHLTAVGARLTVIRMLRNLARIYDQMGDHGRGMLIADRLADLAGALDFVRDRGLHALALGAHAAAAEDLSRYLDGRPAARDADAVREALAKARAGSPRTLQ